MDVTAYWMAQRFIGMKELPGEDENSSFIMSFLRLDNSWPQNDETPWCSGFVNYIAWLLRLPRSKSLMARSWLQIGFPKELADARPGWDVIILKRGNNSAGPDIIQAPGHVGFYAGQSQDRIYVLGGNQNDAVTVSSYPKNRLLGVRSLG